MFVKTYSNHLSIAAWIKKSVCGRDKIYTNDRLNYLAINWHVSRWYKICGSWNPWLFI